MNHGSKSRIILEGVYQIALATAASLCVIALLILLAACDTTHGPDTARKFDPIEGPNFGPAPKSWEILTFSLLPLLPFPRGRY